MTQMTGLQALASGVILSPFTRLNRLLADVPPGHPQTIEMTAGDPKEAMPGFIVDKFKEAESTLGSYPRIRGSDGLRGTIAKWIERRYSLSTQIDAASEVLPTNGSREGLFFAALPAVGRKKTEGRPAIIIPNPFYQAYLGATYGTNAEPVYLNATEETGHLPNLDELEGDEATLRRTAAFYLCSPANPQGAVASRDYITRALNLARKYDFMLFFDECYSEIYNGSTAPTGGLEVAATTADRFKNIVVFNSLSKRSNLPGLRSGFAAGDAGFLETMAEIRNLTAPQVPGVVQHASAAVWAEEQHVTRIRQAYRTKFDICDELLTGKFGYKRPPAGFFLWLNVSQIGGGIDAAVTLWKRAGVKVTPGVFLAQDDRTGYNPGRDFIRVALVHDPKTIREALTRLVSVIA